MTSLKPHIQQPDRPVATLKRWDRSHATRCLEDEVTRANREPSYRFSILMVELEGLSDSVGRLGYAAEMDAWSRALGFLLQDLTAQDLCCRLSGDEFLLILPGRGHAQACELIERLKQRWNPAPGSREADIRVSIGIASYSAHGSTIGQLLCAADESLHADRLRFELVLGGPEPHSTPLGFHH